jgi:hypothetical protein
LEEIGVVSRNCFYVELWSDSLGAGREAAAGAFEALANLLSFWVIHSFDKYFGSWLESVREAAANLVASAASGYYLRAE